MADASEATYDELTTQDEVEAIMREGGGAVIIDFWSETCGPCRAMAGDFAHVAGEHVVSFFVHHEPTFERDEVRFCKVNTGTHGHLAAPFKVRSIPTLLYIHDGRILDATVGRVNARQLGEKAEWLLKKSRRKPGLLSRLFG